MTTNTLIADPICNSFQQFFWLIELVGLLLMYHCSIFAMGVTPVRIEPGIKGNTQTVTGNGTASFLKGDGDDDARNMSLNYPSDVVVSDNYLYVIDTKNHSIHEVNLSSGNFMTIAGNGSPGYSGDGGPSERAQLNYPWGVAVDSDKNLYIADADNHRIRKIDSKGIISTVAGNGIPGTEGDSGVATSAQLNLPNGVAIDKVGNLYISEAGNHVVRKVDANTQTIIKIAGTLGVAGFSGDGGHAVEAKLNNPKRIVVTNDGIVYITDKGNHRIRKIDTKGIITTIVGNGVANFGGDDGPALGAQLNSPSDIAIDNTGTLYIVDTNNHRIRKVDKATNIITTLAGSVAGFGGDNGQAVSAQFNTPDGIAISGEGHLLIADSGNHRVRMITGLAKGEGTLVTNNLWIMATIYTEERGPIEAVWRLGGDAETSRGDRVIWGYFHASPSDVGWGNLDNPDAFVKIWYDVSGRVDVNFFHVSVPDIEVTSSINEVETPRYNIISMSKRYARHTYQPANGIGTDELLETVEAEIFSPNSNPTRFSLPIQNIKIGALLQTVERGTIDGVWQFGGSGTTRRGDQVTWGFFYANPAHVSWGSKNNPELYVKVWYDAPTQRIDVNFFHVSVPDIEAYSDFANADDVKGAITTKRTRYTRHDYFF
jgi:sugar lactone lactonase YvrE